MGSFTKLKKVLEEKRSFILVCHVDPDGDAIGSLTAFSDYLRERGKNTRMLSKDEVPSVFDFMPLQEITHDWPEENYEAIVLLDNGDFKRTGFQKEVLAAKERGIPIINIDHHPKNDIWKVADINYAFPDLSSTCEILFELIRGQDFTINSQIATSLLAGIFYDTGGFQHQNTTRKVLDITGELLKRGARLKKISEKLSGSKPVSLFKLWGIALKRLTINKKYKIAVSVLRQEDLDNTGAKEEEISGLVNLLNAVPESDSALLLYESQDGKIKGSLRTEKEGIDLSKLAALLCGGGHKKAAGFAIEGKIEKSEKGWKIV